MNININNLQKKLMDKADWVAFLVSAYERGGGDIGNVIKHYTSPELVMDAIKQSTDLNYLKYKLFDSPHLYSMLFKGGLIAYILGEFGVLAPKYKKLATKVMWGSGLAAFTLHGSSPESVPRSSGMGMSGGNSETWRYQG